MSENRCRRCNRPLGDPEAAYGWRCAQIMGYHPESIVTSHGNEISLMEHAVHQALELFDSKGIEYYTPQGEKQLYNYIDLLLSEAGIDGFIEKTGMEYKTLEKASTYLDKSREDHPRYGGAVAMLDEDGFLRDYPIYVPELTDKGNIVNFSGESQIVRDIRFNWFGALGSVALDDMGSEEGYVTQGTWDSNGTRLMDAQPLPRVAAIASLVYGLASAVASNTSTSVIRLTKVDTRQGPQVVIELASNSTIPSQYAGMNFRPLVDNGQKYGQYLYDMADFGKRLGYSGKLMYTSETVAKERITDPYLYYLFKQGNNWYGYARRYPDEKITIREFSGQIVIPAEEVKVIQIDKQLSKFLDETLSSIQW